jgi:Ca2+-transporting ATPase
VHGSNELEKQTTTPRLTIVARQFKSPLIYILLAAAVVSVALGQYSDAGVIVAVLGFNAVVGFFQEDRAERSLDALRRLAVTRARVVRDDDEREVDAAGLVTGDVVLLDAGSKVPADCRVLTASALEADESLLTGESATVAKTAAPVAADAPLAERLSVLFMGTVVTRGHCRVVVTATGTATELGRIAGTVRGIETVATPLQERLGKFTRLVGIAAIASSALGLALGLAAGEPFDQMLLAMVALAVAALPEGLPIVLTIVLAISVSRMAARRAIVRRLPAVETLGSCTVIGSDKTGTLTQNRMTVESIYAGGREHPVTGHGGEVERESPLYYTLLAGALCNEARAAGAGDAEAIGDPTEVALLVSAGSAGLDVDALAAGLPRVADIPFDSDRRYAATFHRRGDRTLVLIKGAPEQVTAMCASGTDAALAEAHAMAARGLRVLAMAWSEQDTNGPGYEVLETGGLRFAGLQGMIDPPRPEARAAVASCRRAGIRPLMITGDHAVTALAIARDLGIAGPDHEALTGRDLDGLTDAELEDVAQRVPVYARVSPHHKLRIVEALQRRGEVVAVTGDGVNDAPALKAADIGAAMGGSGTDVAKDAADMVVTDDNFATIVAAVEEGRVAFDNVRKTTFFLISSNAAAVLAVLASLVAQLPLPFVAAQLLWLNLVTNSVQDIALAFEPGERGVLDRRPRPRGEGVISRVLWERTLISAVVMATGTLVLFLLERDGGASEQRAQTVALTALVVFSALHAGNARSEYLSAFRKSPFSNPFLLIGTIAAVGVHALALQIPFTQSVLHLEPLRLGDWVKIVIVGLSVIVAVELHKLVRPQASPTHA